MELPATPEMLRVARRVLWFEAPRAALTDPARFLAYLMTYGTIEDLAAVETVVPRSAFDEALDRAPPGVFDARSWAYWHRRFGRAPVPPLPVRRLP